MRDSTPTDTNRDHDAMKDDSTEHEVERLRREVARLKSGAVNQGFVQVSRKYLDDLDELAFKSPAARKLLTSLVKAMNKQNAVMVSQESLVKLTGMSRPTVQRAVTLLREQQWIDILKVGTANVYRVNSGVFWTARADGRWASFSAEVLLNFDEQDEKTKAQPTAKLRHIPFVQAEQDEDVLVTGTALGSDDPPEQAALDFHKG
ncbi:helix-turn-helix domain-containing protein (plasmid) [Paraburkholderia sp. T12-10]|nr:helix-turn-helix domain-containing protein [Paraburkholderia sp. T12-10]